MSKLAAYQSRRLVNYLATFLDRVQLEISYLCYSFSFINLENKVQLDMGLYFGCYSYRTPTPTLVGYSPNHREGCSPPHRLGRITLLKKNTNLFIVLLRVISRYFIYEIKMKHITDEIVINYIFSIKNCIIIGFEVVVLPIIL